MLGARNETTQSGVQVTAFMAFRAAIRSNT